MKRKILRKKSSLFLFIILMILSLIPLSGCGADQRQLSEEKTKMVQYLEKKYARQFVVEDIKFYSEYFGALKQIEAKVYPKDDKELTFTVYKYLEGNYSYPTVYKENYLGTLWAKQEKSKVEKYLKDIFDVLPNFSIKIRPSDKLVNRINGKVPSIDNILNESNKEINYTIKIYTISKYNEITRLEHAEKIFKLIGMLKKNKIEKPWIYYVIDTDKQNKKSIKYICWIDTGEIMGIKNSIDIVSYFKKYEGEL